jgi:hypothetical protein
MLVRQEPTFNPEKLFLLSPGVGLRGRVSSDV